MKVHSASGDTTIGETQNGQRCERCGGAFRCGALAGDATCWCAGLPALPADALHAGARCLCPACLKIELAEIAAVMPRNVPESR